MIYIYENLEIKFYGVNKNNQIWWWVLWTLILDGLACCCENNRFW